MILEFKECYLNINGNEMVVEHPVTDARSDGDRVYIIFDYSDFPPEYQANNLECFDSSGKPLWCAKSPVESPETGYVNFLAISPELVVGCFSGYNATIDKSTGKIISVRFAK